MAIMPCISRSCSTIVAGLLRGLDRPLAIEYSFLLALPATFGAGVLGIKEAVEASGGANFSVPLIIGVITSTVVGVLGLKLLISLLMIKMFHFFSYYFCLFYFFSIFIFMFY